jgi:hypothetical protein
MSLDSGTTRARTLSPMPLAALALLLTWSEISGGGSALPGGLRPTSGRAAPTARLPGGLRVLFLGDSNDRMLVSEWCAQHGHPRVDETKANRDANRGCTGVGTDISVSFVWFRFFHTLAPALDSFNSTASFEATLLDTLSGAALAATKSLGGPPDAVVIQSLFHDLMWTWERSPEFIHGMHASGELWGRWLSVWSTIAMAAIRTVARSDLAPLWRTPRWIGWRTANHVGQGDRDGWLLLAAHIPLANDEAARVAQIMGVALVDFATFSANRKLKDWTHPELAVHGEFSTSLLQNLSRVLVREIRFADPAPAP